MNNKMGRVNNIDKFDGKFFGFLNENGNLMNAEGRLLLEATYECIIDAGQLINH